MNSIGIGATQFESDEKSDVEENYGILDKIYCKLCEEAMKLVEKEINKDSSVVSEKYFNLILFLKFFTTYFIRL